MDADTIQRVIIAVIPILIAITFHEAAHGYAAYKLGDGTAKVLGRLTLNPLAHIDPVGTVLMPLMLLFFSGGAFAFGYAKPVPISPINFKNPRRDMALTALAGPGMNIAIAVLCVLVLRFVFPSLSDALPKTIAQPLYLILQAAVTMNVWLAAFNLLPVPPLDGGRVLSGVLPGRQAVLLDRLEPYGMIIVIILIATGLYRIFVMPMASLIISFLRLLV